MISHSRKVVSLEILRALCALLVFFNHLYSQIPALPLRSLVTVLGNFATEAVVVFFVLSGCVISMRPYGKLRDYLRARAIRILPAYYVALALSAGVMIIIGQHFSLGTLIGNLLFLQTLGGYITHPLETNLPTWSLSNEASYYLMFPLIGWRPQLLPVLVSIGLVSGIVRWIVPDLQGVPAHLVFMLAFFTHWLAGVFAIRYWSRGYYLCLEAGAYGFVLGLSLSRVHFSGDYYDFTRLLCVAIGAAFLCSSLIGAQWPRVGNASRRPIQIPIEVRLFGSLAVATSLWFASNSLPGTKMAVLTLLLVSALSPEWVVCCTRLVLRPVAQTLVYIGGLSYALYVIHYPILAFVNTIGFVWPPLLKALVAAVISFALAHLLDYSLQARIKRGRMLQTLSRANRIVVAEPGSTQLGSPTHVLDLSSHAPTHSFRSVD